MNEIEKFLAELADRNVKLSASGDQLTCYAPAEALTADMKKFIVQRKLEIIDFLSDGGGADIETEAEKTAQPQEFPLSRGGASEYLTQKLQPEIDHGIAICVNIDKDIDLAALGQAWSRVLERYPILTARIVERDGIPYHRIDGSIRPELQHESTGLDSEQEVVDYFKLKELEPFDLRHGPLVRISTFGWGPGRLGLFILVHHVIFDGFSSGVLLSSLFSSYKEVCSGSTRPLSTSLCAYRDFVEWETRMLVSEEGRKHAEYWSNQLSGDLPSFRLLPEAPRSPGKVPEQALFVKDVPAGFVSWLSEFAKAKHLQYSTVFLSLFNLALHKYSRQQDLLALMPVIVRPGKAFVDEVGYFFNIMPVRSRIDPSMSLSDFFLQTQKVLFDSVFHSNYPFSMIKEDNAIANAGQFELWFAYQEFHNLSTSDFMALRREYGLTPLRGFHRTGEHSFQIALEVVREGDDFSLQLQGDPSMNSAESINGLLNHLLLLMDQVQVNPDLPVSRYSIASDDDRKQVVTEWNETEAAFPDDQCIHDFFLARASAQPQERAVYFDGSWMTYLELSEKTAELAIYLQSLGVEPDCIVAICLDRSIEMMLGIVGTVRAGGAYAPIDPHFPDERIKYVLGDTKAPVVLTQGRYAKRIRDLVGESARVIALDEDWGNVSEIAGGLVGEGATLRRDVKSRHLAYVIYTSGSTGNPKGVQVEHRSLVNRIHWMQKRYSIEAGDVVLQKTPYSFDVSVWEFFWPLFAGAAVVIAAPDGHLDVKYIEDLINDQSVTTLHYVPSMLHGFLDNATSTLPSVKTLFCSGEALGRDAVDRYGRVFPNAKLHNLYGPTEAAIDVTYFDCSGLDYPFVPIGKPIDNTQIYILDEERNPLPVGVPGELHIAGVNLARGYLNRPELTEERFVASPFVPGTRMYKSGDMARWLEDGNIQYLGRIDTQVKIKGVRVETGEIESHLMRYPGIAECVVVAHGAVGEEQLVAFYRATESSARLVVKHPTHELRSYLLKKLPEYVIPSALVSLAEIPVTSNGKADRGTLAKMEVYAESSREYVSPTNDTERELVEIWTAVLSEKDGRAPMQIGINDSFFDLGGNSFQATQLLYRIRSRMDVDIRVRALFEHATIAELAGLVLQEEAKK